MRRNRFPIHVIRLTRLLVLMFALITLSCATSMLRSQAAIDGPVVTISNGQLRGVIRRSGGAEFLGIPFAQPPVGNLRWREPQAVKSWSGIRDASSFGAPCAQTVLGDWNRHDAETSKEDCLFLNVITPEWPAKKPLPDGLDTWWRQRRRDRFERTLQRWHARSARSSPGHTQLPTRRFWVYGPSTVDA